MKTRKPSQNQPTRISPTAIALRRIAEKEAAAASRQRRARTSPEAVFMTLSLMAALAFMHVAQHLAR